MSDMTLTTNSALVPTRSLGRTRRLILAELLTRQRRGDRPPSLRELAALCRCQVNNIAGHLNYLRRMGLVAWETTSTNGGSGASCRTLKATCRFLSIADLDAEGQS